MATVYGFLEGDPALNVPGPAMVAAAATVAGATALNLLGRFLRWQFLLRRLGVRVPTLPSLGAFLGSFAFLPIPLFVGQLVARARLTPAAQAEDRRAVVFAALAERAFDAWSLVVLALPFLPGALAVPAGVAALAATIPAVRSRFVALLARVAELATTTLFEPAPEAVGTAQAIRGASQPASRVDDPPGAARAAWPAIPGASVAVAAGLSLAAWLVTAASFLPAAWAAGIAVDPWSAVGASASAILAGAASLIPLGAGISGLVLLRELEGLSAEATAAALAVFVFRAGTVWLTLALGAIALVVGRLHSRASRHADHFDHIDACYDAWLPPHYRRHVVDKKMTAMSRHLGRFGPGLRGLDIGCGRGWYLEEFRRAGVAMIGLDPSVRQLAAARRSARESTALVRGSVLDLPFAPGSFDFAYVINVLHHLPSVSQQHRALAGMGELLRPGGRLFVHEMNVVNPIFRAYLGYVFPILKGIEEGTEHYLDTRALPAIPGLRLAAVEHFTFVPDFAPPALLPRLARLERRLEAGPLRRYAAHFMAVFERV